MKKTVLILIAILLMSSVSYADVTNEILAKEINSSGNIVIKTQYKVDGVEVDSAYSHNGKKYWYKVYNYTKFLGMSNQEIIDKIDSDIVEVSQGLVVKEFTKKQNEEVLKVLDSVIGTKNTVQTTQIIMDTDNDGTLDKTWTIKTDGTKTEKIYVKEIITP